MEDQTERMYELMRKESNRLKTFQMNPPWPKDYVDIKKLAKAGFFYSFNGDNVHCAFCRGQVCRWDRDDDPMSEHSRHFTTCPFIMGGEVGNEPLGDDPFPGPKRPRPYDVCGQYPSYPPNDPRFRQELPLLPVSQGDQQPRVDQEHPVHQRHQVDLERWLDQGIHMHRNHNFQQQQRDQELRLYQQPGSMQWRFVPDRPPQTIDHSHHDQSTSESASRHEANSNSDLSQFNYDYNNIASNPEKISPPSNCSSSGVSSSSIHLNGICKICYTNSIELVFLPCGHSLSCLSCAQRLYDCPYCRATITTKIRTFYV